MWREIFAVTKFSRISQKCCLKVYWNKVNNFTLKALSAYPVVQLPILKKISIFGAFRTTIGSHRLYHAVPLRVLIVIIMITY